MLPIPIKALKDNYIWLILERTKQDALCVDPGDAKPIIDYLKQENCVLTTILLTHHHADHVNGVPELINTYPQTKIYGPKDSRLLHFKPKFTNHLNWHQFKFKVLMIPGHTSSHICFFEISNKWLFCGDTLFSAGCGRVFDGTMEELYLSLERIKQLPDETKIFCAHEYTMQNLNFALKVEPTNHKTKIYKKNLEQKLDSCTLPTVLKLEKEINPFLRLEQREIQQYLHQFNPEDHSLFEFFSTLRKQKDIFNQ